MAVNKKIVIIMLIFFVPAVFPGTSTGQQDFPKNYYEILAALFFAVIILIIMGFLYYGMDENKLEKRANESPWMRIKNYLTQSKNIDSLISQNEIKETENRIPAWFSYLFYGVILFSTYYMIYNYMLLTGNPEISEFDKINLASLQGLEIEDIAINENNVERLIDSETLNRGKEIFKNNCVACHAEDGGGSVGPNLTDKYWLHGGGIINIFKTIKYGVPEKGMISWQKNLSPRQIQDVAGYVLSLEGSSPAKPKEPQGEIYIIRDSTKSYTMGK